MFSPACRRSKGATFTPPEVVTAMISWAIGEGVAFKRIIDPGAGSGRFAIAAARAFPTAQIIAIENDSKIVNLLRANIAVSGLANRVSIITEDYRSIELPSAGGRTLFIGNPPYLRHHEIGTSWKQWYLDTCRSYGLPGSGLAGLHLHFLLKTHQLSAAGDRGCFITAAEWLDVNYGSTAKAMLMNGMGGRSLHVIDKSAPVFSDALTSAVILCFQAGAAGRSFQVQHVGSVHQLGNLRGGKTISYKRATTLDKWSRITHSARGTARNFIELGELFKVHRGQVTGTNRVWIASEEAQILPHRVLLPTITRATEIINARKFELSEAGQLRRVVDLPRDLDEFSKDERSRIETFLNWARSQGAHETYIAQHRRPWWHVGLGPPAPIIMTYMARRPPVFVRNACGARILNIAHGLYPLTPVSEYELRTLIQWLNKNIHLSGGRTYAGGLTKFEPGEVMKLRIPRLETIRSSEPV